MSLPPEPNNAKLALVRFRAGWRKEGFVRAEGTRRYCHHHLFCLSDCCAPGLEQGNNAAESDWPGIRPAIRRRRILGSAHVIRTRSVAEWMLSKLVDLFNPEFLSQLFPLAIN